MQRATESGQSGIECAKFDLQITDEKVQDAVRRVVAAANPLMVIAFGSWARGEHRPESDLDIAVILDEESSQFERGGLQKFVHDVRMSIDLLDVSLEGFERKSLYLDSVYRDVAEEGILLYARSGDMRKRGSAMPKRKDLFEVKAEELECVMEKATSGERTLGIDGIPPQIAAMHGHQAIGKLLKAWLIALDLRPPRGHVLSEILQVLMESGVDIPPPAVAFEVFEDHAARYRYLEDSDDGTIDLVEMRRTVRELSEHVRTQIAALLARSYRAGLQPLV